MNEKKFPEVCFVDEWKKCSFLRLAGDSKKFKLSVYRYFFVFILNYVNFYVRFLCYVNYLRTFFSCVKYLRTY